MKRVESDTEMESINFYPLPDLYWLHGEPQGGNPRENPRRQKFQNF